MSQFSIIDPALVKFEIVGPVLERVKAREFEGRQGISVLSHLERRVPKLITIATELNFVAYDKYNNLHTAAKGLYVSHFNLLSSELFAEGPTEEAVELLMKMIDLAQAHAYSISFIKFKEHKIPLSSMEVSPKDQYRKEAMDFLKLTDR